MKYNPEICGKISAEDEKAVFDGLLKYNMEYLEDKEPKDLGIYIRDDNHQVKAGLIGLTHGNWLIVFRRLIFIKNRGIRSDLSWKITR